MPDPSLPSSFVYRSKTMVTEFLDDCWESYKETQDNDILQKRLEGLFQLGSGSIKNLLSQNHLKILMQLLGYDGAAFAGEFPVKELDVQDEDGNVNPTKVYDLQAEKIVKFAGIHQVDYLLFNTYFLIQQYLLVKSLTVLDFQVDKDRLINAIINEIWITINSYQIRKMYGKILTEGKADQIAEYLDTLLSSYLDSIKKANKEDEFEFCFPCGSKDHAMYLTLLYRQEDKQILLRVDNSGRDEPIKFNGLVDINQDPEKDVLINYLKKVCLAITEGLYVARGIVYNQSSQFAFRPFNQPSDYQQLEKQTGPNCVVEGFRRGMWHRLWKVTRGGEVFRYLFRQAVETAAVPPVKLGPYEMQCAQLEKIYAKRKMGLPNEARQILDILLKNYQSPKRLEVERLSGASLSASACTVNLSIRKHKDRPTSAENVQADFNGILSDGKLYPRNNKDIIQLQDIFKKQDEKNIDKVCILGSAGMGKTTLCKKIVADFTLRKMWADKFQWLLWIPLRNLKGLLGSETSCTLGDVFYNEFFKQKCPIEGDARRLASLLWAIVQKNSESVCFLLDGWDEIAQDASSKSLNSVLNELLNQKNVILTTRPYTFYDINRFDSVLETVGFAPDDVQNYLKTVFGEQSSEFSDIRDFLKKNRAAASLARIPIQLDIICYSWNGIKEKHTKKKAETSSDITLSEIYQMMSSRLWLKYINRDEIKNRLASNETFAIEFKSARLSEKTIAAMTEPERIYLKYIAYISIQNNQFEFDNDDLDSIANMVEENNKELFKNNKITAGILSDNIKKSLFFVTDDEYLDEEKRCYHFPHLLYRDVFVAQFFAESLRKKIISQYRDYKISKQISIPEFIALYKFDPHYQNVWPFVAGILLEDIENLQIFFDYFCSENIQDLSGFYEVLMSSRNLEEACLTDVKQKSEILKNLKELILFFAKANISNNSRVYDLLISYINTLPQILRKINFKKVLIDECKELEKLDNEKARNILKFLARVQSNDNKLVIELVRLALDTSTPNWLVMNVLESLNNFTKNYVDISSDLIKLFAKETNIKAKIFILNELNRYDLVNSEMVLEALKKSAMPEDVPALKAIINVVGKIQITEVEIVDRLLVILDQAAVVDHFVTSLFGWPTPIANRGVSSFCNDVLIKLVSKNNEFLKNILQFAKKTSKYNTREAISHILNNLERLLAPIVESMQEIFREVGLLEKINNLFEFIKKCELEVNDIGIAVAVLTVNDDEFYSCLMETLRDFSSSNIDKVLLVLVKRMSVDIEINVNSFDPEEKKVDWPSLMILASLCSNYKFFKKIIRIAKLAKVSDAAYKDNALIAAKFIQVNEEIGGKHIIAMLKELFLSQEDLLRLEAAGSLLILEYQQYVPDSLSFHLNEFTDVDVIQALTMNNPIVNEVVLTAQFLKGSMNDAVFEYVARLKNDPSPIIRCLAFAICLQRNEMNSSIIQSLLSALKQMPNSYQKIFDKIIAMLNGAPLVIIEKDTALCFSLLEIKFSYKLFSTLVNQLLITGKSLSVENIELFLDLLDQGIANVSMILDVLKRFSSMKPLIKQCLLERIQKPYTGSKLKIIYVFNALKINDDDTINFLSGLAKKGNHYDLEAIKELRIEDHLLATYRDTKDKFYLELLFSSICNIPSPICVADGNIYYFKQNSRVTLLKQPNAALVSAVLPDLKALLQEKFGLATSNPIEISANPANFWSADKKDLQPSNNPVAKGTPVAMQTDDAAIPDLSKK